MGVDAATPPSGFGSQLTAENPHVDIEGATLVYRRLGATDTGAPPLVCLQHFRGNLDNWDPALIDRLASDREVILVDNRGVGGSTGVVPDEVAGMARDVLRFVDVLGLRRMDLLGFSLGGYVAQEEVLVRPRLIRRLVLAGTAPQGAPRIHRWSDDVYALATQDELDPNRFIKAVLLRLARPPRQGPAIPQADHRTDDRPRVADVRTPKSCRMVQG